jgi:protein involved in polysaccharide export with SLBB domain
VVADFEHALEGDEFADVLLMDGDKIVIPKRSENVEVIGQVADPGEIRHVPGKRFTHYIREAGGYSSGARRNRATVIRRATGEWVSARRAGALEPGDTIWIPERLETDWWRVAREVAAFVTSVVTAYVVIDQAVGN